MERKSDVLIAGRKKKVHIENTVCSIEKILSFFASPRKVGLLGKPEEVLQISAWKLEFCEFDVF